jgi:biopolymer transport protein TolQ
VTWAIIFIKFRYFRKAFRETADFTDIFWQCRTLADAFAKAKALRSSPAARIFIPAYMEINRSRGKDSAVSLQSMGSVQRILRRSITMEIHRYRQLIPFLATVGNTAPFIGLFGTVWGIMHTFQGIGLSGSASLAVVAPGISEALIATAAGLAAAIPAVMAYNHYTDKIRVLNSELETFSSDLLNIIERDIQNQMEA